MHLLQIMETVVPIGPTEWDEVLDQHCEVFPGRDVDSLRRKYTTQHADVEHIVSKKNSNIKFSNGVPIKSGFSYFDRYSVMLRN